MSQAEALLHPGLAPVRRAMFLLASFALVAPRCGADLSISGRQSMPMGFEVLPAHSRALMPMRTGGARNASENHAIRKINSIPKVLPHIPNRAEDTPGLCGTTDGKRLWLTPGHGTSGGMFACLIWTMSAYQMAVMIPMIKESIITKSQYAGIGILYALSLSSHLRTMLTNPGSVPRSAVFDNMKPESGVTFCSKCQAFKPRLAHHCRVCGRCISRMDHHCPWVNNCVGAANQKHFVLFLVYTFMASLSTHLVIRRSLKNIDNIKSVILRIVPLLHSTGSLIFVGVMIFTQMYGILSGKGTIDRMFPVKGIRYKRIPFREVFGDDFAWLLPTKPVFKEPKRVYGFSLPLNENLYTARQAISDATQLGLALFILTKAIEFTNDSAMRKTKMRSPKGGIGSTSVSTEAASGTWSFLTNILGRKVLNSGDD